MRKYIIKNHYYITRSHQITINKKERKIKECIGFCKNKEDLKSLIKKAFYRCIELESNSGAIYWCNTHKFFADILRNKPSIEILVELKSFSRLRNVNALIKCWECCKCSNCEMSGCYIPYYTNMPNNLPNKVNHFIIFRKRKV